MKHPQTPPFGYAYPLIKHPIAAAALVAGACLLWTVVYILLLAWAVVFDQPVGGPLAYPAGLLFWSVAGGLAWILIFLPGTIIGNALAGRLQLKPWWGLLMSILLLPLFAFVSLWLLALVAPEIAVSISMENTAILSAVCLLPLAAYWLMLLGADWVLRFLTVFFSELRKRMTSTAG